MLGVLSTVVSLALPLAKTFLGARTGGLVADIVNPLTKHLTNDRRLRSQEYIADLNARRDVAIEHGRSIIRPAFLMVAWLYFAKLVVYDTMLGLGTTPPLGGFAEWTATAVVAFYFMARPFERR